MRALRLWKKLEDMAKKLREQTEILNDLLSAAEDKITALQLGVRAEVVARSGSKEVFFGFAKLKGEWCIYVTSPGEGRVPVLTASVELRSVVAANLETLIVALCQNVEEEHEKIQKAIATCEEILAAFKESERLAAESR